MHKGIIYALLAAALFGASTPFSKALLGQVAPVMLAGLLYLGSGLGLLIWFTLRAMVAGNKRATSARLTLPDLPWLGGAILSGGIAGPVLLMIGLTLTPASSASLLLNMEGVLTVLLAWFVFKGKLRPAYFLRHGLDRGCRHHTVLGPTSCARRAVGSARHRRGVPVLGHRQQSHPQDIGRRCGANRGDQRLGGRFGQPVDYAGAWFAVA